MIVFVFLFFIICLAGLRFRRPDSGVLSKEDTASVNGIFVVLIFLSHATQYTVLPDNLANKLYTSFQNMHNQWVVATFLAFSGYGVMHSYLAKGSAYLSSYPYQRLLKTLVNYLFALALYLLLNGALGIAHDGLTIAGSLIGLTSIGNSNWYIFTILLMYLCTYCAALAFKKALPTAIAVSLVSVLYICVGHITGLPSRFYSTAVCYSAGLWLALYRKPLLQLLASHRLLALPVIVLPILLTYRLRGNDYWMNVSSVFFVLGVVWFLTCFRLKSPVLLFLGKHAFSIYILQRIPMLLLEQIPGFHPYAFVAVSLGATVLLAVGFDRLTDLFWQALSKRRAAH